MTNDTKICPFCKEEVQAEAVRNIKSVVENSNALVPMWNYFRPLVGSTNMAYKQAALSPLRL